MKIARIRITGVSPLSMSKPVMVSKEKGETADAYEKRTWRNRIHTDANGQAFVPPMMIANCIKDAAAFLGEQIPGKGKSTYKKHFDAGIRVMDPVTLPVKSADIPGMWLFVPSDGKPGGGKRVMKCFPLIEHWGGEVDVYILDDVISREAFQNALNTAGLLIGIGSFRPAKRGYFGNFKGEVIDWKEGL